MEIFTKQYVFGSLFLLSNKLQVLGDQYLQEITLKQWFLLMMIHNHDKDQPSVSEIAIMIGSTRQNVRKMLSVLEAKGYVSLKQNTLDKRNLCVALSDLTYQFFNRFEDRGNLFLEELFDDIPAEQLENCRQTFVRLFDNIERMEQKYEKNSCDL